MKTVSTLGKLGQFGYPMPDGSKLIIHVAGVFWVFGLVFDLETVKPLKICSTTVKPCDIFSKPYGMMLISIVTKMA